MTSTALLGLLVPALVLAPPPSDAVAAPAAPVATARLEYHVETSLSGCPDARELRAVVSSLLGHDPFRDQAPLRVRCQIDASGGQLRADITVTDARLRSRTRRRLAGDHTSCGELAGAAALAIAIAIDPLDGRPARSRRPPPGRRLSPPASPARSASAPPAPAAAPVAAALPLAPPPSPPAARSPAARAPATAAAHAASRPRPFLLALGAGLDVVPNLQPAPAVGMHAVVRVRRGWLGLGLDAQVNAASQSRYRGGSISGRLLGGLLSACGHGGRAFGCGIVAAGGLSGAGAGFAESRRDLTPFAAAGMRLGWQQPIGSGWSAVLEATGLAPVVRTTLWIDKAAAWVTPRVGAQASLLVLRTFGDGS